MKSYNYIQVHLAKTWGKRPPSWTARQKIANLTKPQMHAIGVSLDYLICGDEAGGVADPQGTYGAEVRSAAEANQL